MGLGVLLIVRKQTKGHKPYYYLWQEARRDLKSYASNCSCMKEADYFILKLWAVHPLRKELILFEVS